jgi:hypothetical protein
MVGAEVLNGAAQAFDLPILKIWESVKPVS